MVFEIDGAVRDGLPGFRLFFEPRGEAKGVSQQFLTGLRENTAKTSEIRDDRRHVSGNSFGRPDHVGIRR
jgi:hypothetical protein